MAEFIAILGIFATGATAGIIAMASLGIRREERRFRRERRYREENGNAGSAGQPTRHLAEDPDDPVISVSRILSGLFIRHLPADLPVRADHGQRG